MAEDGPAGGERPAGRGDGPAGAAGGGLVGLCAVGQQPGVRRCRQCAGRAVGLQAPAAGGQQPLLHPAAGHQPRCLRVADAGRHGHRLPGGAGREQFHLSEHRRLRQLCAGGQHLSGC